MKSRRQTLLDRMNSQLDLIREFHQTSLSEGEDTGIGTRALIERLITLRKELVALRPEEEERLPSYLEWKEAGPALAELEALLAETGADPVFSEHPFSRLQESLFIFAYTTPGLRRRAATGAGRIGRGRDDAGRLPAGTRRGRKIPSGSKIWFSFPYCFIPAGPYRSSRAGRSRPAGGERTGASYAALPAVAGQAWQQAMEKNADWTDKLGRAGRRPRRWRWLREHEGSFLGMLNGAWRKLKQQLQQRYDFSRHSVKPSYTTVLESLQAEYAAAGAVEEARRQLEAEVSAGKYRYGMAQHRPAAK
jgi:hypothetical protein